MDPTFPSYVDFVDGTCRWSPNIASTAWVIYSPSQELIHIDGMCVGIATNNQVEYDIVASLMTVSLHLGILHLDVFLESKLLITQLNNYYWVHDPYLFRNLLCTRHLVRNFKSISFMNASRSLNSVRDQMSNAL